MFSSYKRGEVYAVEEVKIPPPLFKSLEGRRLVIMSIKGNIFSREYGICATYKAEGVTCKIYTELTRKQMELFFTLRKEKRIDLGKDEKSAENNLKSMDPSDLEKLLE